MENNEEPLTCVCSDREAELLATLARSQSDFANFRRRSATQLSAAGSNALADFLLTVLPILDDADRSASHSDLDLDSAQFIHRFVSVFESLGLVRMEPVGTEFDPKFHEALSQEPSADVDIDTVGSVYKAGYLFGDNLLRPASVHVLVAT